MNQTNTAVWVVDDDKSIRWVVEKALNGESISTESFAEGDSVLNRLEHSRPTAIISDIRMPGIDGLKLLKRINDSHPDLPVIITTAHSDLDSAVAS
jgi:two-component system nitrogen regulation response regulator GlnG